MKASPTLFAALAVPAMLTAVGIGLLPARAQSPGVALNYAVTPSPGYGTTCTYTVAVSQNGKPVVNTPVVHWFSGQHSVESYHKTAYTNKEGKAIFLDAIPISWKRTGTWVDLDAACPKLGAQMHWRVK